MSDSARMRVGWRGWFCVLASLAAIAGCAGPSQPPTPTPEPVTLRFSASSTYEDVYSALITEFHKTHPNVTVEWTQVGGPGARSQLTCATCDVIRVSAQDLTADQLAKYLPLDDIVAATKDFPRDDMTPGTLEALRYGGLQVAIPAGINPIVAYYNPEFFRAASVRVPDTTWTLDDLATTGQALGRAGATQAQGVRYGFCSLPQSADPAILTYLFGGQLVDNANNPTRVTLNSPQNIAAVQWYASLRRTYQATPDPDAFNREFSDLNRAIFGGRCGIWLGFYLDHYQYQRYLSDTGRPIPGMLPLPRGRDPFGVIGLDGYAILRISKQPDVAWQWIRFLLDHPEAAGPILPPRPSQYRAKTFAALAGADAAATARNLPSTLYVWGAGLSDPVLGGIVQAYLDAVEQVVRGETDAETALGNAQVKAEAIFAKR
jgi:ABC-type glycerol-3-phosphate transport system substrate-binding protein